MTNEIFRGEGDCECLSGAGISQAALTDLDRDSSVTTACCRYVPRVLDGQSSMDRRLDGQEQVCRAQRRKLAGVWWAAVPGIDKDWLITSYHLPVLPCTQGAL